MNRNIMVTVAVAGLIVAACDSGDINIQPSTTVTDSNNTVNQSGGGTTNPCAAYVNSGGQTIQGSYDGTDCNYPESFVGAGNNLTVDLTIPALPNGGAHIFEGSLFVGETYRSDAELAANGIVRGGDGAVLTIEAGATLAWRTSSNFLIINRGSQIFAVGTAANPISFTSVSDVEGTVGAEDVQQWGGIVINGFGVTNKCAYTGTRGQPGFALAGECHVDAEGAAGLDESQYGGDNDDDSSGRLEYVIVKHTGATVGNGDELNGISFGGVGRNTIVRNLQVYSTFDDGIEMFGGAVSFENFVALYVRDDAIDIDEGWQGSITRSLVIQSETDGNHCIEADGIGDYANLDAAARADFVARNLNSRATIRNLTCIVSPNGAATATHDPGAGWRLREGLWFDISDTLLISSFAANDTTSANDNYCLRIQDQETIDGANNGDSNLNSVVYACQETYRDAFNRTFAEAEGNVAAGTAAASPGLPTGVVTSATSVNDANLQLLEGVLPIYSIDFATSVVCLNAACDDATAPAATATPTQGTFLGALSLGETDWAQGWAYGIYSGNRAQPLWFEAL
ncbi:MAG: serine/threonine protein kinase [Gammaproteobacteria bacterium]|nr:serine/threonine protein kinase [Gammaproteobacteria bacterium]MDH4253529.1 serine/threonine protein kinase [Gammaproteobacteria bacterium]